MRIEVVEDVRRSVEIELDWDELYARDPHATIFLSSRFIGRIALRTPGRFRILLAWDDNDRCVGAFPLLARTRWSKTESLLYNELDMLGHVYDADYTGFLCDPALERSVCEAFARTIAAMPFARLILSNFSSPAERLQTFLDAFDANLFETVVSERRINSNETNNLVCPYIELPDAFEDYLQSLSANTRQRIRRLLRKLGDDPDLQITRSRLETYGHDAAILSDLWFLQYAERKGAKRARQLAAQLRELAATGLASGIMQVAILWRNGKPVAAQANYIDPVKRSAHFHVAARDDTVRDLQAGALLHAYSIRWAIAQRLTLYDFTLGDEPYKYQFGARDRKIACVEVLTRTRANTTGALDPGRRQEVVDLIRKYAARGWKERVDIALQQAEAVWPEVAKDLKAG